MEITEDIFFYQARKYWTPRENFPKKSNKKRALVILIMNYPPGNFLNLVPSVGCGYDAQLVFITFTIYILK